MTSKRCLIGESFGRLEVLSEEGKWVTCRCICGVVKTVRRGNLMAGYTQSCGCLQKERSSAATTKHGLRHTALYKIWRAMKTRCYNPNHRAYRWYGAKGVKVCDEWQVFDGFVIDMGAGYIPGLSIDRINPQGDYCKANCRWLSKSENSKRGGTVSGPESR